MLSTESTVHLYLPQSHVRSVIEQLDDLSSQFKGKLKFIDGVTPKISLFNAPLEEMNRIASLVREINESHTVIEQEFQIESHYLSNLTHPPFLAQLKLESGCIDFITNENTVTIKSKSEQCCLLGFERLKSMTSKQMMDIPEKAIGYIIGTKGSRLKDLIQEYKCHIEVIDNKLCFEGPLSNIKEAMACIQQLVNELPKNSSQPKLSTTTQVIYVNDDHVGTIIGVQGKTIKQISYNSRCQVSIDQQPNRVKQPVSIIGSLEDIEYCKQLINESIAFYEEKSIDNRNWAPPHSNQRSFEYPLYPHYPEISTTVLFIHLV